MKSMMILVLLSGVFAKPVPEASKTVPAPTNAPPTMVTVGQIDRNIGEIRVKVLQQVPVTVTKVVQEVVNVNGNQVVVERAVAETTMKTQISERKVKIDGTLKIMEATGEKMATEKFFDRVKSGDTILHAHGTAIDEAWLRVLRPDVIVLLDPAPPQAVATAAPRGNLGVNNVGGGIIINGAQGGPARIQILPVQPPAPAPVPANPKKE